MGTYLSKIMIPNITKDYIKENNIIWYCTPTESPDINPIENLWHEMKEYIHREIKPRTKEELVEGILQFGQLWMVKNVESI